MFQEALSRPQTEQAAGGHAHQRLNLLVTGIQGVVPHMPPHGEPPQGVRRDFQRQHPGEDQRRNGQRHGAHTAGTKIRDHKEGAEENQRRAEIVHQGKQAADENGIGDKNVNIPLAHDSVHGGRAGIDEADLAQFRRL